MRAWLSQRHVERHNRRHPLPQTLVRHIHLWDWCRQYGIYRYRICLRCEQKRAC